MKKFYLQNGYVAISIVLVITAVILLLIVTTSLVAISEGQMSLANKKGSETSDFVDGCAEDALIRISKNNSLPASLILPEGTCTVTIDSHIGNDWTFTVSGVIDKYTKKVQVQANRGTQVTITNWKEVI